MWDCRFARSALKVEDDDVIVPLGTMVSFWIVARIPRWDVEVMRLPRADLSSWEAMRAVSGVCEGWKRSVVSTGDTRLHLCKSLLEYSLQFWEYTRVGCSVVEWTDLIVYIERRTSGDAVL
jgi:hypothetical protein